MPYTMNDFRRDFVKQFLHELTPEELVEGLSVEQIEGLVKQLRKEEAAARKQLKDDREGRKRPTR